MREGIIKSTLWGLAVVGCFIGILFASIHLPVMEVVRHSMENRIDSDAYFYTEVEGFQKYENAVAQKRGTQYLIPMK